MYVYMYIDLCIGIHMYMYACTYVYVYVYVYAYTCVYAYAHMCMCIYIYIHLFIYFYMYILNTYICIYIYTHITQQSLPASVRLRVLVGESTAAAVRIICPIFGATGVFALSTGDVRSVVGASMMAGLSYEGSEQEPGECSASRTQWSSSAIWVASRTHGRASRRPALTAAVQGEVHEGYGFVAPLPSPCRAGGVGGGQQELPGGSY